MDASLLERLLGGARTWSRPCTVILDAEASVKTPGPDTIGGGGIKSYAPRYSTGRIEADTCCLMPETNALVILQQLAFRDNTGREQVKQTLQVIDLKFVVGLEFANMDALKALGLPLPVLPEDHYRPGTLVG